MIFESYDFKKMKIFIQLCNQIFNSGFNSGRKILATVKHFRMNGDGVESSTNIRFVNDFELNYRGCKLQDVYRNKNPFELKHTAPIKPSHTHTVLYHYPIQNDDSEPPTPVKSTPKWDAYHVRLPCSSKSQYPTIADNGECNIENRWQLIKKSLLRPIKTSQELQEAILLYNKKYEDQWDFRALHRLFNEELDETETETFFEDLLPRIIQLALRLPELIQSPIPLLKQGKCHTISLTQEQISCLLANAFLCTFPRRNTQKVKTEYSTFPDINFNHLFQAKSKSVIEKIKCICNYFRRVCPEDQDRKNVPTGCVTFERRFLPHSKMPNWADCTQLLGETLMHVTCEGTIEDQGDGLLQVDFANKYIGGGVLGNGCVQEEIRFVICPELIISKLFTEALRPTEALIIIGCERYSNYSGYANSFHWDSNHIDNTSRDLSRRRITNIVAIDALSFVHTSHQYREELILRELNKAYVGFYYPMVNNNLAPGVASGNWGCGAFGGDAYLKALLQLMACTINSRPLVYFTFGNAKLRDELFEMYLFLKLNATTVGELYKTLRKFRNQQLNAKELYIYIRSELKHSKSSNQLESSIYNSCVNFDTFLAVVNNEKKQKSIDTINAFKTENSDSDAFLAEAVDEICSDKITQPVLNINKSIQKTIQDGKRENKRIGLEWKQPTLLEMLDVAYGQPLQKKHCVNILQEGK